jgi:hypothetical protein
MRIRRLNPPNGFQPPGAATIGVDFGDDSTALRDTLASLAADKISVSVT